jgi:hypothetical protein
LPPRDFAAAVALSPTQLLVYGGHDGAKWLDDVHVFDTQFLTWTEVMPLVNQSVNQVVNQSISQGISQPIYESVNE